MTLLLVDDDAVDRESVRRALRAAGVEVTLIETHDPDEVVARATEGVECILLDYHLPGTDGLAVLRRLRAQGIDLPVIALTGHGDEHVAVELMKAGAADYLSKQALTPDRLERSLRHAIAMAAAERQRRELLAREQAAREEAQAANRVKDEFLATLSHELRTPLNAILGWAKMLGSGQLDSDTTRRGLATIERNVALQTKLIDDLLDVSRIVTGKLAIERSVVSLGAIVCSAVESQRPIAAAAGLTVTHAASGEEAPVIGDAARLEQVVTNLLSNAIKFTPRDGAIDVRLEYRSHDVVLSVRDTGVGIKPEFLPFVFDRFRQGDPGPSRPRSGLGLGLAIVQHLVEAHGGRITAESAGAGDGATFTIVLPTVVEPQMVPVGDRQELRDPALD